MQAVKSHIYTNDKLEHIVLISTLYSTVIG
jgi:hypothetical protein